MPRSRSSILLLGLTVCACAVNRPVTLPPDPSALSQFIAAHHPAEVLVTDSSGHAQLVTDPRIDGDSLRGLRNRELPRERVSIPLSRIRGIAVPEFSTGRTLGLVGALVAAAVVGVLILTANGGVSY